VGSGRLSSWASGGYVHRGRGRRQEHAETFAQAEAGAVRADFGGGDRDPQGVGDLDHRQPFDVVPDDDGPVVGRELVDG
jgi:hypothetical protein